LETNIYDFYNFANEHIVPLMPRHQGLTDEEIHIGISRFHSSYMPLATLIAESYGVDSKQLIKRVSDINCINPDEQLFKLIASELNPE
jgi:4-hydroxy 2-oxovalerate aldolase